MKQLLLTLLLLFIFTHEGHAQTKEILQYSTLSPTLYVVSSSNIEPYLKNHFTLSAISYLGIYAITESQWKAAVATLLIGASKELIYDGLMNQGDPNWNDMAWNTLGVTQGLVFTMSLKF